MFGRQNAVCLLYLLKGIGFFFLPPLPQDLTGPVPKKKNRVWPADCMEVFLGFAQRRLAVRRPKFEIIEFSQLRYRLIEVPFFCCFFFRLV